MMSSPLFLILLSFFYGFLCPLSAFERYHFDEIALFPRQPPGHPPIFRPGPVPLPRPAFSVLTIQTELPVGDSMEIVIQPLFGRILSFHVPAYEGKVYWQTPPLAPGEYQIFYSLPPGIIPLSPDSITLGAGEERMLQPILRRQPLQPSVQINANTTKAAFKLRFTKTGQVWQGQGSDFRFSDLLPGNYELEFASQGESSLIAPQTMRFYLNPNESKVIKATYQQASSLALRKERPPLSPKKTSPPPSSSASKNAKLIVTMNLTAGGFTLRKMNQDQESVLVGHYSGKNQQPSDLTGGTYLVIFDELPTYQAPVPIEVTLAAGAGSAVQADYTPIQESIQVEQGPLILGNEESSSASNVTTVKAFSISPYPITNAQYASWLNQALQKQTIFYIAEADNRGQVVDLAGHLLCKTFDSDPYSQIAVKGNSGIGYRFEVLPGKELYPVINVTWQGAKAYCQDHQGRLATEAEWERAAGMDVAKESSPLHKYRYGFSQDSIDASWANYKDNIKPQTNFRVLTTPVGFYNGVNWLPLTAEHPTQMRTHLATSPYGAYDMSGNVWEWIADDAEPSTDSHEQKIAKGGCYASLAEDVRVDARIVLPASRG